MSGLLPPHCPELVALVYRSTWPSTMQEGTVAWIVGRAGAADRVSAGVSQSNTERARRLREGLDRELSDALGATPVDLVSLKVARRRLDAAVARGDASTAYSSAHISDSALRKSLGRLKFAPPILAAQIEPTQAAPSSVQSSAST